MRKKYIIEYIVTVGRKACLFFALPGNFLSAYTYYYVFL